MLVTFGGAVVPFEAPAVGTAIAPIAITAATRAMRSRIMSSPPAGVVGWGAAEAPAPHRRSGPQASVSSWRPRHAVPVSSKGRVQHGGSLFASGRERPVHGAFGPSAGKRTYHGGGARRRSRLSCSPADRAL